MSIMLGRLKDGKLYFCDVKLNAMVEESLKECETKKEVKFFVEQLKDYMDMLVEDITYEWDLD